MAFEGTRALGEALAGRPLDALRVAAGVRRAAAVSDMTILRTELALAEALAYRELGDRSRAMAELGALAEAPAETMLFCRVLAMCELAEAHLDGGDLDAAWHVFGQAEAVVEAESLGRRRSGLADPCRGGPRLGRSRPGRRPSLGHADRRPVLVARSASPGSISPPATDQPRWRRWTMAEPRCVRHEVVLALLRSRAVADRDEAMKYASTAVETRQRGRPAADRGLGGCRRSSRSSSTPRGVSRSDGSTACGGARRRREAPGRPPTPRWSSRSPSANVTFCASCPAG